MNQAAQSVHALGGAPCAATEPLNAVTKHRACMIQRKKWVATAALEFALSHDAAFATFLGFMFQLFS